MIQRSINWTRRMPGPAIMLALLLGGCGQENAVELEVVPAIDISGLPPAIPDLADSGHTHGCACQHDHGCDHDHGDDRSHHDQGDDATADGVGRSTCCNHQADGSHQKHHVHDCHDHDDGGHDHHAGCGHGDCDHDPPPPGPHGGLVIELGRKHRFHAELVRDTESRSVVVYVLDAQLQERLVRARSLLLNLTVGENTTIHEFATVDDAAELHTRFRCGDPLLFESFASPNGFAGKLRVTIDGIPYIGQLASR